MTENIVIVRMAELDVVSDARRLKTILGSCVGIILRDPERGVSGLSHIMLPVRQHDDTAAGKYADSAIPALLKRLAEIGGRQSSLQALLIGGAQMFPMGSQTIASIGNQNVETARRILQRNRIPIVFEDIGGSSGRSVVYDNATGQVSVKTLNAFHSKEVPA
ncbi:MAG TPA: chemotaxis protein CheD [Spirochaetia bacterium]|nr:chemotaxis protein CheD [Spirochaetia bacterium]